MLAEEKSGLFVIFHRGRRCPDVLTNRYPPGRQGEYDIFRCDFIRRIFVAPDEGVPTTVGRLWYHKWFRQVESFLTRVGSFSAT